MHIFLSRTLGCFSKAISVVNNKAKILIALSFIVFSFALYAQVPQGINYQAVARDASGNPITQRTVSVRITINNGVNPGFPEYQETHLTVTNQFGLFTLKIGLGEPVFGVFNSISIFVL